jgi:hypothetical protein
MTALTSSLLLRFRKANSAWAKAEFSSAAVEAPIGTSGSAKTLARKISASVGRSENFGVAGGGSTLGAVLLTTTFVGVSTGPGAWEADEIVVGGARRTSAAASNWACAGKRTSTRISTHAIRRSGKG